MTETGRPQPHKTTHQAGGADEINATGLTGITNYVDRGDLAIDDFDLSSLTSDWQWHDISFAAIVPTGTKQIYVKIRVYDTGAGSELDMRTKGYVNEINIRQVVNNRAGADELDYFLLALDPNRTAQYRPYIGIYGGCGITVLAWII